MELRRDTVDTHQPDHQATHADLFAAHRRLLFTIAYEMLGSVADAEDVVQATWLKWIRVDREPIQNQRAYLAQIAAREALGHLRAVRRRRESYVGLWLPEPLLTVPELHEDQDLADSLSASMLLILESLTPTERAVFVLREVFGLSYDRIAEAINKSAAAARQIAHRARTSVAARRPRSVASTEETTHALAAFQQAIETGDLQQLMDTLAPDVVLMSDGGGVAPAALAPIVGVEDVARLLMRIDPALSLRIVAVSGRPGLVLGHENDIDTVISVWLDEGRLSRLYVVRNPQKLWHMRTAVAVER
jgi:RNA polymerase sigma-70 factor (ECF subfamily)